MTQQINTIDFGGVNCYLVKTGSGFILIDTGYAAKQVTLHTELEKAGCKPGNLGLIILTHGDHDHAGNCTFLREKYGAKIAMHAADLGIVERGDMGWNRKARPDKSSIISKMIGVIAPLFNPGKFETLTPDLTIDEGYDLSPYSFDSKILHLPGHSKGSIGILTGNNDLFCGDFFRNKPRPSIGTIDDPSDYESSFEKLKKIKINQLYPGHGRPFRMNEILSLTGSDEMVQRQP